MRRKSVISAVVLTLLFIPIGISKNAFSEESTQCVFLPINEQVNNCAVKAYQIANKKLTSLLRVVRSQLTHQEEKDLFVKAQDSWILFRETYCELAAYRNKEKASYTFYKYDCLEQLTRQRATNLQKYLENLNM